MLADYDSQFMSCKGLVIHYKLIDGSLFKNQDTVMSSYDGRDAYQSAGNYLPESPPLFPSTWNPLLRAPTASSLRISVQTPLLSNQSSDLGFSPLTSPGLNGWPAIVQQTALQKGLGGISEGLGLPTRVTTAGNIEPKEKGFGVIFLHGFGGGVFSWRHVMSTVARDVGCRVAAFDRPGWGLTSRTRRNEWEQKGFPNPYDLHTQVLVC